MNIGLDASVFTIARAGVWNYHYNLLAALIEVVPQEDHLILVDDRGIHGQAAPNEAVRALLDERTSLRSLGGLRHRRLSRMPAFQESSLAPLTRRVDQLIERPWAWAADQVRKRQFEAHLSDLDVFHVSDVLNQRVPGAAAVTTIHDLTTLLYPDYHTAENIALLAEKYRFAQEEADKVIAVSHSTREDIVNHLGIEPDRIAVVPYGCDPRFRPLADREVRQALVRWGLEPGGYLLYVGTIEPRKNLVRLLDAYAQVRGEFAQPQPKLVLAGAIGWKSAGFMDRIGDLDLDKTVQLLGPVASADLPALYNGAIAMVYPSLYEGFGLPPLEAMASGAPVITSRVSSIPEVVGEAALLIDPTEVDELAAALLAVVNDPGQQACLRKAGLERAQRFTWRQTALATLDVYREAATGSPSHRAGFSD